VRRPQGVCNVGEKPWSLIACRLNDPTVETRKGLLHEGMLGILIACSSRLLHDNVVAHGVHPPRDRPPVNVASCVNVMSLAGIA
jgi:hypothetical protein